VNMDETTFAFSPKVLDRAFTMEIRDVDLSGYPLEPAAEGGGADTDDFPATELLTDFTRSGAYAQITKDDVWRWSTGRRAYVEELDRLNKILSEHDFGFGYRVVDEVLGFLGAVADSPVADALPAQAAFDQAVLMKVLPKMHGTLQRLRQPLTDVMEWAGPEAEPRYPRTYKKLARMLRDAQATGHASFS